VVVVTSGAIVVVGAVVVVATVPEPLVHPPMRTTSTSVAATNEP
jgi:hypothetical protein